MYSYPFIIVALSFFIITLPVTYSQDFDEQFTNCSRPFNCGRITNISYPFWGNGRADYCGLPGYELKCEEDGAVKIAIEAQDYSVLEIREGNQSLKIATTDSWNNNCPTRFANVTLPPNLFTLSNPFNQNLTLFYGCPMLPQLPGVSSSSSRLECTINGTNTNSYWVYLGGIQLPPILFACNGSIQVPVLDAVARSFNPESTNMEDVLKGGFDVQYMNANASSCNNCEVSGGNCGYQNKTGTLEPTCFCFDGPQNVTCPRRPPTQGINKGRKAAIGVGVGLGGAALVAFVIFIIYRQKKSKFKKSSGLISRDLSFDESSKPDPEMGSTYFQTPIFTYKELDEATNHFDTNKELGDGGFGTVYHGKLRDGRVVAVKRLFEHNYKRVEQFMNEIVILSQVRHRNLVSLYGCTNRHSRELLLVYEYVPNGTVADHLHGDHAKKGLLTWPIRMSIAIESADALAYLHASDIIHRDVKTNNILLDDGFHVKVADFGLSRLFPTDVTHVSTAPQGTPGYVDPEYYQCYQLNDKSDVYSFGVVLIELISSKQAVDIGRHRHEINLASMAIKKIHNQAIHELVDPTLGFEYDYSVKNMITLVAELAFRCLQQEKEMRPSMVEVLETLRGIENEEYKKSDDLDIPADARLLKNSRPLSPDSVTDLWGSKATTPNTSA